MAKIKQKNASIQCRGEAIFALLRASGTTATTMGDVWNRESVHMASFLLNNNITYKLVFVKRDQLYGRYLLFFIRHSFIFL